MSSKIIFLHIEKAAGSTIHDIMYANFLPYYVASPVKYVKGEDNQSTYLESKILNGIFDKVPGLRAAGGHSLRCYNGNDADVFYFAFLRDPVSRYISHYFYQKEVMGIERTFEEFLDDPTFSNFMCRKLSSQADAGLAIRYIQEKAILLCLVERFDESLLRLAQFLAEKNVHGRFKPGYEVVNSRSSRKDGKAEVDAIKLQYLDRIVANNNEDIKLYEFAKATCPEGNGSLPALEKQSFYRLRVKLGKLLRRVVFVPLEKRAGFQ
ncbi:MAG: sulfotransferase family 2 domain-containing protein [Pseudomonadota bacterium]|nr:sulfotransferase family 2 domain-containing protein [Pseudomonadota bacterium]MEE3321090.1 sulfotransferase family 2 domain-containing protein [Pseudomonadota bacterium]